MSSGKLKLDLHPVYDQGDLIDQALQDMVAKAVQENIREVEIITGKGSGQLKKRVLKFLERDDIKKQYYRIKKDFANSGRIFVYFLDKL